VTKEIDQSVKFRTLQGRYPGNFWTPGRAVGPIQTPFSACRGLVPLEQRDQIVKLTADVYVVSTFCLSRAIPPLNKEVVI
jgi:hypothetical protein